MAQSEIISNLRKMAKATTHETARITLVLAIREIERLQTILDEIKSTAEDNRYD